MFVLWPFSDQEDTKIKLVQAIVDLECDTTVFFPKKSNNKITKVQFSILISSMISITIKEKSNKSEILMILLRKRSHLLHTK